MSWWRMYICKAPYPARSSMCVAWNRHMYREARTLLHGDFSDEPVTDSGCPVLCEGPRAICNTRNFFDHSGGRVTLLEDVSSRGCRRGNTAALCWRDLYERFQMHAYATFGCPRDRQRVCSRYVHDKCQESSSWPDCKDPMHWLALKLELCSRPLPSVIDANLLINMFTTSSNYNT
jgi:hypothetical protein